jgi:hypothetical protein
MAQSTQFKLPHENQTGRPAGRHPCGEFEGDSLKPPCPSRNKAFWRKLGVNERHYVIAQKMAMGYTSPRKSLKSPPGITPYKIAE